MQFANKPKSNKKSTFIALFLLFIALLLTTCQLFTIPITGATTEGSLKSTHLAIMKTQDNHKYTLEQLQIVAEGLVNYKSSPMRSAASPEAMSVTGSKKLDIAEGRRFSTSGVARSAGLAEADPVELYAITVGNKEQEGFVIACNDKRIGNILAIVDNGQMDESNPFMGMFFERLEKYIDRIIDEYEAITKTDIEEALSKKESSADGRYILSGDQLNETGGGRVDIWGLSETNAGDREINKMAGLAKHYGHGNGNIYLAIWDWTDGKYAPIPVQWGQGGDYTNRNSPTASYALYENNYNVVINYPGMVTDITGDSNHYTDTQFDKYLIAGCSPVAIAQIMAYHKYPPSCTLDLSPYNPSFNANNPYIYAWTDMTVNTSITDWSSKAARESVGILLYEIGKRANSVYTPHIKQKTTPGGIISEASTSTSQTGMIKALKDMGYIVPAFVDYNFSTLRSSIIAGRPVITSGSDAENKRHTWVIDGTRKMNYSECLNSSMFNWYLYETNFVHCNFGWVNSSSSNSVFNWMNGWYVSGVFDTMNVSYTRSTGSKDYSNAISILPNVSRP